MKKVSAPRVSVRQQFRFSHIFISYLLIFLIFHQPVAVLASATKSREAVSQTTVETAPETARQASWSETGKRWLDSFRSYFETKSESSNAVEAAENAEPLTPAVTTVTTDGAISIRRPSLNGGRIEGTLRVFSGESFNVNSTFQLTRDLYTVGTPNITVNSGASHGGIINDGGSSTPSGYGLTLNSGAVLPGKIHIRANALALPPDIPSSVPSPSGSRYVNVNSPSDVNNIGSWSTVRDLNVSPSNLVINVPPGNYGTFSMNGNNIRLVFSQGVYNFAGTINLNAGSRVETNGRVTINIGQGLNVNNGSYVLGNNTLPGDVRINVIGSSLTIDNGSQINALLRAKNANVNLNSGTVRGQLIANYLNINNGLIVAATCATDGTNCGPDTTAPTATITEPANNSQTTAATIAVKVRAADSGAGESGVASVAINQIAATYDAATDLWQANVPLAVGSNTIQAKARDGAGNEATAQITVTRNAVDTVAPQITVTTPANNSTTTAQTISVAGTAVDTGTPVSGVASVTVNNQPTAFNAQTGQWSLNNFPLVLGSNTIVVRAVDNAGNASQSTVTVTRSEPPDTAPPVVSITSPANNAVVSSETITVTGTAFDNGAGATGVNRVLVNNQPAAFNAQTGQWSIENVQLAEGENTIRAVAFDNAAPTQNSSETSIIVIRRTPDTQPPTLSVTTPANNSETFEANITIAGTALDEGLNASGIRRVLVNGNQAIYNTSTNQWNLDNAPLSLGENVFTIIAEDNAPTPNTSQAVIRVTRREIPPPTVSINNPANNSATTEQTVTVSGLAAANGPGSNQIVKVLVNGREASYSAASTIWTIGDVALQLGANTITAKAIDSGGRETTAQITVTRNPGNQPPVVNAGADQTINLPNNVNLNGTATDDGLPQGSALQTTWSKVSGAGDVTFADANALNTTACFSAAGVYVLRLTATDGAASTSDEVTVTIKTLQTQIIRTGNGEIGQLDPQVFVSRDNGQTYTQAYIIEPYTNPTFGWSTIPDTKWVNFVNSPWMAGVFNWNAGSFTAKYRATFTLPQDYANPTLNGTILVDNDAVLFLNGTQIAAHSGHQNPAKRFYIDNASLFRAGENVIDIDFVDQGGGVGGLDYKFVVSSINSAEHNNQTPVVFAGARQNAVVGIGTALNGTVRDDYLPSCAGQLNSIWTKVSGPGNVAFGNPQSPTTTANFSQTGVYVLKLTAADGQFTADDEVIVNVAPQNQPPVVNAGADQTINLPANATLNAAVTDDGLPQGASVTVVWSKMAGPGEVNFANANAANTTAAFSLAGIYVLRLTASDTALSAFDEVTIQVAPANAAPVAADDVFNINSDFNIKVPHKFVARTFLSGSPFDNILSLAAADNKLYVGNSRTNAGEILEVNLTNKVVTTLRVLPIARPGLMIIGDGRAPLGNDLIVSDNNAEDASPCCNGQVFKVNRTTGEITVLSNGNPAFPPYGDPYGLALSQGGGFDASLYVMDFEGNSPNPPVLFTINPDGTRSVFLIKPDIWTTERFPLDMIFGRGNGFGNDLFVADPAPSYTPAIWRVTAQKNISSFISGEPLKMPGVMKFAPGGLFGTELYILDRVKNSIFKVSADGTIVTFARDLPINGAPASMDFAPDGNSLFVSFNNKIVQIAPASLAVAAPGVLANDTDSENNPLTASLVSEPSAGTLTFNPNGSFDYIPNASFNGTDSFTYRASDGNLQSNVASVTIRGAVNQTPVINAGPDQSITLENSLNLNGAISDDGLPAGQSLTATWSKLSGPGTVTFGNAAQPATTALFSSVGTYTLRLTASDGELSISDDVTVIVYQVNRPPTVNAGPDQTIIFPATANLNGIVTDDGLPAGSSVSAAWSKVSGPGEVTFGNPNAVTTTAGFGVPGVYVLRLTATDTELSASDEIRITVSGINQPPVVNAGEDQSILLPAASNLSASVTDDGNPQGGSLSVVWSKSSGPGDVTFTNPNSAVTTANFNRGGVYVLRLTASDTAASSFDEVIVTVNPFTPSCPSNDFAEDFNDNSLDPAQWRIVEPASPVTVFERNSRLELVLQPSTAGYNRIASVSSFNLKNRSFEVEVPEVSSQWGYTETFFIVRLDEGNYYLISMGAGSAVFDAYTNGTRDRTLGSHSPAMRFWRVRHSTETNKVYFETSANAEDWMTHKIIAPTFALNALKIELGAGAYAGGNGSPGKAVFDNLRIAPTFPSCAIDVEITSPAHHASIPEGTNIPITVAATDRDGQITKVEFFRDGVKIGEDPAAPYEINWQNAVEGTYNLLARAHSNRGFAGYSSQIEVHITRQPSTQNRAPAVNAGPDQVFKLPAGVALKGVVTDDNLPAGGGLISTWTKVSGPGEVAFENAANASTTATFSKAGYYVLRLSASDSELTATDEVIIKAAAESAVLPGGIFITGHDADAHSLGSEGARNIIRRAISYVTYDKPFPRILLVTDLRNPGGDQTDSREAMRVSGFTEFDVADYGSNTPAVFNAHTVNFGNYDVVVVASDFGGWLRQEELDALNARRTDLKNYVNNGGSIVAFSQSGQRPVPPGNYAGTRHRRFAFVPLPVSMADFGQHEAGIRLTAFGELMGLTNTDVSSNVSHNIFLTSGGMEIVDVDSHKQIVSLAYRGKYVTNEGFDNDAPVVDAGRNQTIVLPVNSVSLQGTVSDDGAPAGGSLTRSWSKVSGPGTVAFSAANSLETTAGFSEPGTYVLRLSSSDGQLTGAADVSISVTTQPQIFCNSGDDFNDNERDAMKWLRPGTGAMVMERNQRLEIKAIENSTGYGGYLSAPLCDMNGMSASVEVLQTTNLSYGAETYFIWRGEGNNYVLFAFSHGSFVAQQNINGSVTNTFIGYDPNVTRYWRIAHDQATNQLRWQTSPDNQNWTTHRSEQRLLSLSNVRLELQAGTYVRTSSPGTAVFDNLVIRRSNNAPPTVNLTSPANNAAFMAPANITLRAEAAAPNGAVSRVEFYAGTTLLASDNSAPYEYAWNNVSLGDYNLRAVAYDGNGGSAVSTPVSVFVTNQPVNQPPSVNAGADQAITLPASANLNATVTDDGLPQNGNLTVAWSKVSGAGTVAFGDVNANITTVSFGLPGTYVLRLTASDGALSASDEITITVNAAPTPTPTPTATPTPVNNPPTANAGADKTATLNANFLQNPGAEAELINGELPAWTRAAGNWTRAAGGANNFPAARFGQNIFYAGDAATAELRQDVDVRAFEGGINAQTQQFEWRAFIRSLPEAAPDAGRVVFEYRDAANQNTIAALDSGVITTTSGWHETEDVRVPPAGTGWIRIRLIATRNSGTTNDVFFDAMSLRAVGNVAAARLEGATSDDGLPAGSTLTSVWSRQSGAGDVAFSNPNAAQSAASFNTAGTHVLRLAASDGQLSASDDATVTVNPANIAPIVNAGADQAIQLPNTVSLSGTASDDGAPQGSNVSARWSKVSGIGVVTFANANALNTTASFSMAGTYVLRLSADDGDLEASDEITITVAAAPNQTNHAPTVEAGQNQTIQLPTNTVNLSGTATDDGLPQGSTLQVTWSKTSGAGDVAFATPNAASTTATFSAAGAYVLRLTATDGQLTSFDEVVIIVNPAAPTNQAPVANAGPDRTITQSQQAPLEGQAIDDGLPQGNSLTFAWSKVSGAGDVTFTQPNSLATYAAFSQTGTYVVRLTVSDGELSASDEATITVAENTPAPNVDILTPDDGASLTAQTQITGTVSSGDWRLEYALQSDDNPSSLEWTLAGSGAGAASGTLGALDTTLLLNGTYAVRLMSTDQYGRFSTETISVVVESNLKVGHFTVAFEDLNVPVAGLPISVVRTYDSRDKRRGDFGAGWTLGLKTIRVEKSNVLGLRWAETVTPTFPPKYCVEATRPHIVSVTMPDGKVEKFEARVTPECQNFLPITGGNLVFTPQSGTKGRLEVVGDNAVQIAGSIPGPVDLIGFSGQGIFDSGRFRYTAKDGTQFVIDQRAGLQSVRDTNGNQLTVTPGGIVHSSGKSVTFTRDAAGRITQITDPAGNVQTYAYDEAGDLISFTDRENNTTRFGYEPQLPHHLKTITDPLNRTPIRNEYDADGRLSKHVDAFGKEIVYTHNLAARVEIVRDRLGRETRYEYDERGNVLKKVDAKGGETAYTYDADDNVLTETNALGKTTTYTYDAQGNRLSVKDALNNLTTFTYNSIGRVLTVTDARNKTTTNTYDTGGNLLTSTDADGKLTTNTYSIQTGLLVSTKDALDNVTTFEYFDGTSYVKKQTDALNNQVTFTYDQNGNRKSETRTRTLPNNQTETLTTEFEYDKLNRLTKTVYPDGTFTRSEYNETGQQTATIDQQNRRTEFEYDEMGRLKKTIYADSSFEESTYDDEGRRLTSKDRAGRITKFDYDELGRLIKTTYPDQTFTETTYDAAGQVKTSKDARGNVISYSYDDAGRRTSVKNALNEITEFTYDAAGNQLTMKDARQNVTTFEYDNLNRRTKTIFADSSFTQTTYDELGRRTEERDQAGKLTKFAYDKLGRLLKVTDALNQETVYRYDELGQQISQTDANNQTTRFEYDSLGRRIKRTLPGGQSETYTYFTDGSLKTRTDFNGKTTTFAYDSMRRLLTKIPDASLNQPVVSFTYNVSGQRETMTDASGVTTYGYDNRNRLQSKQTPFGTLTYTYDEAGNLKTLRSSNADGVSVDYSYDELNRLKTAKDNRLTTGANITNYSYDAVGNLESYSYPNAVTTSYSYNSLNRLTTLTVSNGQSNLASYSYVLGAAGNREKVTEGTGRVVNYSYDNLYRLTAETISNDANNNGQTTYTYDSVGNRRTRTSNLSQLPNQSFDYDENDRLTSDTYDANGNTRQANGNNYNYDFENRLTSQSGTNGNATFVYDGDGNRVAKTVNGVTTFYLVDTNNLTGYAQVVEELQSNVGVTKQFTFGHDLISQRIGATVSFYQYDGHGSVRQLTNQSGQTTDTYNYDAFGILINRTGTTPNDYLYAGEQFDANLGFYYLRARYMNPSNGRFHSMDSYEGVLSQPHSLNKYLYANVDPVNNIDPSGFMSIHEQNATIIASAPIRTISTVQPATTAASMPLAVVNSGTLATTGSGALTIAGISARAMSFAVSFALALGSVEALKRLKEYLTQGEDDRYVFATIYRWTNELSPSGFRIKDRDNDGMLSTFRKLPSSRSGDYNIPMLAMFEGGIWNSSTGKYGELIIPFVEGVKVWWTPIWGDPNGRQHFSLEYPGGRNNQGEIPQILSTHAKKLNLQPGEFSDPYSYLTGDNNQW